MIKQFISITLFSALFGTSLADEAALERGKKLYDTPGLCATCHQASGAGLPPAFPPLSGSEWVTGPKENLVKIVKYGLMGEIEVAGTKYNGLMPPGLNMGKPLTNEEIADVLTYVRHQYGDGASAVSAEEVEELLTKGDPVNGMLKATDLLDPKTPEVEEKKEPAKVVPIDTTINNVLPEKTGIAGVSLLLGSVWTCLCIFPGITGLGRG